MRILIPLVAIILLLLGIALVCAPIVCHAETFTNGSSVITVSNGVIIATEPLTNAAPVLVTTNGQVVPQAFIDALANATGIPSEILKIMPLKALVWLFVVAVGLPVVSRYARKLIPDRLQTGKLGDVLKHTALEINPGLTPTPPKVPAPAVELKDTATGAIVQPAPVPPANPPPKA